MPWVPRGPGRMVGTVQERPTETHQWRCAEDLTHACTHTRAHTCTAMLTHSQVHARTLNVNLMLVMTVAGWQK